MKIFIPYLIGPVGCFCWMSNLLGQTPTLPSMASKEAEVADRNRATRAANYFQSLSPPGTPLPDKAIYGEDDRLDVRQLKDKTDALSKAMWQSAQSTCLLTSRSRVSAAADGTYTLQLEPYKSGIYPACPKERFAKQKLGGWCSGFMVGDDIVATAGHCCEPNDNDARNIAFIFGFFAEGDSTPSKLTADQVYFGKKVFAHALSDSGDFAIIELDRKVAFPLAVPLSVRNEGSPENGQSVGMIGHPSGLPSKSAFSTQPGKSAIFEVGNVWLRTNLDAYAGNSGSAVFASDGKTVEGILVRGRGDFRVFEDTCCYSTTYDAVTDPGEVVTRASVFNPLIPRP